MDRAPISIIIPAYNEEENIGPIVATIKGMAPGNWEIIVIDDGSSDNTLEVAERAGVRVISHPYNMGNGAAIKTGIRHAQGEVLVMMDGDGQHNPGYLVELLEGIGRYDMVVGAREGGPGRPLFRRFANKCYNLLAQYVTGQKIPDLTSGYRAIKAGIARQFLYLLPNTFSYPVTLTLSLIKAGYSVKYVPIEVKKREGRSKIRWYSDGTRFLLIIFRIATLFSPMKIFIPISLSLFFWGLGYYLYTFFTAHRFTNMSLLLMLSAVLFFLLGLVSEQIAQLRFDRTGQDKGNFI